MSNRNTTTLTVVALILGGLLGMVAGAYIVYAWVPTNWLFSNMAPVHLAYNGVLPQYRDVYVVHVATRHQAILGNTRSPSSAIMGAQHLLGVTTGDVKPDEAIKMVRETLNVVKLENDKDGDGGWFTKADESNLANLLTEIQKPTNLTAATGSVSARDNNITWNRIIGFALLAALGIATALGLYLLYSYLNGRNANPVMANSRQPEDIPMGDEDEMPVEDYDPALDEVDAAHDSDAFAKGNPANIETTQYTHPSQSSPATKNDNYVNNDEEIDIKQGIRDMRSKTGAYVQPSPVVARPVTNTLNSAGQATRPPLSATNATNSGAVSGGTSTFGGLKPRKGETYYQTFPAIEYKHGDENLDEHHNIVGAKDLILGTCGVSVIERLGASKPAEVVALALAVFDKTSMKTTYKVLMTPSAYNDMVLRRKLSDVGELISVQAGDSIPIETNSLLVHVKASDVTLEKSANQTHSYYKHIALTFDAQQRG